MDIYGYHEQRPDWRSGRPIYGAYIGLELEVMNMYGSQHAANILDVVDYGTYPAPIAERDGSLSSQYGVEIVCPPLPVEEVLASDGYIARMMQALTQAGTASGTDGYGMHINFNVRDWDPDVANICTFLLGHDTDSTQEAGGRRLTNACNQYPSMVRNDSGYIVCSKYKYQPARLRTLANEDDHGWSEDDEEIVDDILEFRAPASTLVHGNLRRAVEYVYAVKEAVEARKNYWMGAVIAFHVLRSVRESLSSRIRAVVPASIELPVLRTPLHPQYDPEYDFFTGVDQFIDRFADYLREANLPINSIGFDLTPVYNQYLTNSGGNDGYINSIKSAIEFCREIAEGSKSSSSYPAPLGAVPTPRPPSDIVSVRTDELRRDNVVLGREWILFDDPIAQQSYSGLRGLIETLDAAAARRRSEDTRVDGLATGRSGE